MICKVSLISLYVESELLNPNFCLFSVRVELSFASSFFCSEFSNVSSLYEQDDGLNTPRVSLSNFLEKSNVSVKIVTRESRSLWRIKPIFNFLFPFSHHFAFSFLLNPLYPSSSFSFTFVSSVLAMLARDDVFMDVISEPLPLPKIEAVPLIYFKSTNGSEDI